MKKILIVLFLLFPTIAFAQSQRNPCYYTPTNAPNVSGSTTGSGCVPVAVTNPLPVGPSANPTGGASYDNITSNATTVVKSSAGTLYGIFVNTAGASANTITVYDNTAGSGTKIATIDGTKTGPFLNSENGFAFTTGLTIVTATGTAPDMTVSYK